MSKSDFFLFTAFMISMSAPGQEKRLQPGMRITHSVKFITAIYKIDAPADSSKNIILIEGNDITIDFNNAVLKGSNNMKDPKEYFGIAVQVRNSRHVTIRNLKASGYKIALMARNVEKLTLENCDLSYNYRQHLNSTQEKEDMSDWMSYHHNEKDEWLRYGAAIYLRGCNYAIIRNCKVTGGQNALMMMECDHGKIYNNDFSFNSGIGLGLYRCKANEICYNKIDFNVRGYSHGIYNRGQDSAGILVYEQSDYNVFYKNSVTHGGDGFFLWAGQSTMDSGQGGCNDNLILDNDFSYAPTNGIEVTFSRNSIAGNRIFECDHGIWGGYSFHTLISDNTFRNNRIAIAIEHGLNNRIIFNLFDRDKEAIRLWSRKEQPAGWGYAKYRDTRSADYVIAKNSFNGIPLVFNIIKTDSISTFSNTSSHCLQLYKLDSTVTNLDSSEKALPDTSLAFPSVKDPVDPFTGNGNFVGRKNILITEWGPYDFRYPIIWNTNPADSSGTLQFDLLGPKGKWRIKNYRGIKDLSSTAGSFPASLKAELTGDVRTDIFIELEYSGPSFTNALGEKIPANKPSEFFFKKFFQPMDWEVKFYPLDTVIYNPIKTGQLFSIPGQEKPFKTEKVDKLDYAWWGGIPGGNTQHTQFITVAEGVANIPKGKYELSVTWDDAVKVYIDGKTEIDEWNPSKYTFDEAPHRKILVDLGGEHHFRVEHMELGGFATLSLKLKRMD
jgi:hypothetical protein